MRFIFFYIFVLLHVELLADILPQEYEQHIDDAHKTVSTKVVQVASSIDRLLSGSYENNLSDENSNFIDAFFQSAKFTDETDKSYVNVRFNQTLQSKAPTTDDLSVNAHISLKRTQKKFNLFMHSLEDGKIFKSSTSDPTTTNTHTKQEVGLSYWKQLKHGVKSKYSLGTRGLNPFVRARYNKVFSQGLWTIEPAQQFEYSIKDNFKEQTNLYFDRRLDESSLFRTTLQRETMSGLSGMNYSLSFSYYNTSSSTKGFSLSQSFIGNTNYTYVDDSNVTSSSYPGINNYVTSFNWRQSIWKKWIIYDINPAISFHKQYNYKANYILGVNLNLYFGNYF